MYLYRLVVDFRSWLRHEHTHISFRSLVNSYPTKPKTTTRRSRRVATADACCLLISRRTFVWLCSSSFPPPPRFPQPHKQEKKTTANINIHCTVFGEITKRSRCRDGCYVEDRYPFGVPAAHEAISSAACLPSYHCSEEKITLTGR